MFTPISLPVPSQQMTMFFGTINLPSPGQQPTTDSNHYNQLSCVEFQHELTRFSLPVCPVIGKTPGHQPASLQVHGDIANIMASMEVLDLMEQQFIAAAGNDLMARIASGEIDTEQKQKKLLDAYAEELQQKFSEWENLQVSVVAGAGFEPAAFRL